MNFRRFSVLLPLLLLVTIGPGCDKEEAVDPFVSTDDVQQIGQTSVVIGASIQETGSTRPIEYGFLWGETAGLNVFSAPHRIDLGSTDQEKKYSAKLDNLTPNSTYYVRAFTASPGYTKVFYGVEISFKTLP